LNRSGKAAACDDGHQASDSSVDFSIETSIMDRTELKYETRHAELTTQIPGPDFHGNAPFADSSCLAV
jgi:hypothetical protein